MSTKTAKNGSTGAANGATVKTVHKIPEIDFDKLYETDGYLRGYENEISRRFTEFTKTVKQINEKEGGLDRFASSYNRFGLQVKNNSIYWLEWIPGAEEVYLTGNFCCFRMTGSVEGTLLCDCASLTVQTLSFTR